MQFLSNKRLFSYIDIGKKYLKIVQFEVTGKSIAISKIVTQLLTKTSDQEVSRLLAEFAKTNNIRLENPVVVIPREKVMVRYLRLPSTDLSEIDKMVSFEVTKQTPYSKDEIISDYRISSVVSQGYSDIMLAIAPVNEITRLNDILSSAGEAPNKILLSSEAVLAWLFASSGQDLSKKNISLIDIGSSSTEIIIASKENLVFSRVASIGADNLLDDQEAALWRKRLIDEIKRTIANYLQEKGSDAGIISEFIVTGAGAAIDDFSSLLKAATDTPCRAVNTLSTLSIKDNALNEEGISSQSSVTAVCGSQFIVDGINLIPQQQRMKQRQVLRLKKTLSISLIAGLFFLLIFLAVSMRIYQKQGLLKQFKAMYATIEDVAEETGEKAKKLKVIKEQLSQGHSLLDVIYNLYRIVPANISLVDFDYDDTSRVLRFQGKTQNMSDVFKLVTALEASKEFSNVQTRSVLKRRTKQGSVVDFQIKCNFKERPSPQYGD